jgi:hypothetical protein
LIGVVYLVFAFGRFYPHGGANDLISRHKSLADATSAALDAYKKQFPGRKGPTGNWSAKDCEAQVLRVDGLKSRVVYRCGGPRCRVA